MADKELKWSGGVNLLDDDQTIRDDQLAGCINAAPSLEGLLDKREPVLGVGYIEDSDPTTYQVNPITLFQPDPVLGLDFILHGTLAATIGEFLTTVIMNQVMDHTGANPNTVFQFPPLSGARPGIFGPAVMVNYRGRVIALFGGSEGFYQLSRRIDGTLFWTKVSFTWPAGTVGTAAAQTQTQEIIPSVVSTSQGRLLFAAFGPGMGNWLIYGDRDTQATWTNVTNAPPWAVIGNDVLALNGRHLELSDIQGETILAVEEISLQAVGSPITKASLVLTEKSAVICTGAPAQSTDTGFATPTGYIGDFQAAKVNYDVGIVGPNCKCHTPYGLCWASNDEVWLMNGNLPTRVGTLIRPALRDTPPALRKYWSMAYANGIVFLSIATQASSSELNQRVVHYRLDLRQGPPQDATMAKWFGPQDYQGLPDRAGAQLISGFMTASITAKKGNGNNDIVYGAIQSIGKTVGRTHFVTFNQGAGGRDVPWIETNTGRQWTTLDTVPVGDVIRPTVTKNNGLLYICTVAGVTDVTEPTWPALGGTVVDGTVTWKEITAVWSRPASFYGVGYYGANFDSILMDVLFKDFDFNVPNRDKVARRTDIIAYFGTRALLALKMIVNQGKRALILGPTSIGGMGVADNDLDNFRLDIEGAMAQEYEARSLRPGYTTGHLAADPITYWQKNDTGLAKQGGVVRGLSLQPRFTDDDGLVIDETNNFISWCSFKSDKPLIGILQVFTAELTMGRYANVATLLTEIVAKMNVAQGVAIQGFTIAANPWSFFNQFEVTTAYMTSLQFAFSARDITFTTKNIGLVFGDTLPDESEGDSPVTLLGTTCYPCRTKRLMSMLGYDTRATYNDSVGLSELFSDGSSVRVLGEQLSPLLPAPGTAIFGMQSIPYKRSPVVSLSSILLDYYIKAGLPFSKRSR